MGSDRKIIDRDLIELKPANGIAFPRLQNARRTAGDAAEKCRRYPVLMLVRNDVIHYIEKPFDRNIEAVFLADLPDQGFFKPLAELDAAAGKLPFMPLIACVFSALGEEKLAPALNDDCTNAYADVIDSSFHGDIVALEG